MHRKSDPNFKSKMSGFKMATGAQTQDLGVKIADPMKMPAQ